MLCCALLCVLSSFAIILIGERELVAVLCLSSWCFVVCIVLWLITTVPWVDLQCVTVVFPNHTTCSFCFHMLKSLTLEHALANE